VIHWTGKRAAIDSAPLLASLGVQPTRCRIDVATKPAVVTETGGVVARVTARDRMTTTGFDLREPWGSLVSQWANSTVPHSNIFKER